MSSRRRSSPCYPRSEAGPLVCNMCATLVQHACDAHVQHCYIVALLQVTPGSVAAKASGLARQIRPLAADLRPPSLYSLTRHGARVSHTCCTDVFSRAQWTCFSRSCSISSHVARRASARACRPLRLCPIDHRRAACVAWV